jgi:hypothetical protein
VTRHSTAALGEQNLEECYLTHQINIRRGVPCLCVQGSPSPTTQVTELTVRHNREEVI